MRDIDSIARITIGHGPTPLEAAPRLSQQLGVNIYFKRDDCTGLAGGGNKTRKLEYLLADAILNDCDTLVTMGGIQSNHARQTAAAAAKFGLACELILEEVEGVSSTEYQHNGNLLLNGLLGAKVLMRPTGLSLEEKAHERVKQLIDEGKKPYLIPMGGSNEIGSLGYVRCAMELLQQMQEQQIDIDRIVLATGSAGTQAGLLAGLIAKQSTISVLGICVSRSTEEQKQLVTELLKKVLLNIQLETDSCAYKVQTNGNYVGDGYGISTDKMIEAVRLVATTEGVLLDPVYTGKAMSGLVDLCERGEIKVGENVLFLHTGGSQGLFAYREIF